MNPLEQAVAAYVAYPPGDEPICPPTVWEVGRDPEIRYGTGRNPFEGMTITVWPPDQENAA